jgi:hypothetical protein
MTGGLFPQGAYEIQVYGSDLTPVGATMVEVHSNFTARGQRDTIDGVLPTSHALHETLEVTHGFNDWFETGVYLFTSVQPGGGFEFAGTHLRPRFAVPERYHLPVGLSLSTEIGWMRPPFSSGTWALEIRPIVDKTVGKWYVAFNPALEKSLRGPAPSNAFEFSPNLKVSYAATHRVTTGIEYYGALGPVTAFDPLREQSHQIVPVIDVDIAPRWEFNLGVCWGVTQATDRWLVKTILGYRFGGKRK